MFKLERNKYAQNSFTGQQITFYSGESRANSILIKIGLKSDWTCVEKGGASSFSSRRCFVFFTAKESAKI